MGDMGEWFETYHEAHKERVEKTPQRIDYATSRFTACGIKHELKNPQTGHFHVFRKSDGKLFQFWAGTGKILGCDRARGIDAIIRMANK